MTEIKVNGLVDSYADKLMIGLTNEENEMVLHEFDDIDKQIDLINAIPISTAEEFLELPLWQRALRKRSRRHIKRQRKSSLRMRIIARI